MNFRVLKYLNLIAILVMIFSCSKLSKEHKNLIDEIINNPENIIQICENRNFKLSDLFIKNQNLRKELKCHFESEFSPSYHFAGFHILTSKNGKETEMWVYISKSGKTFPDDWHTEFRFRGENGHWKVLYSIIMPDNSGCPDTSNN